MTFIFSPVSNAPIAAAVLGGLESDPRGCDPIVGSDRVAGHRELIACAEDQINRTGRPGVSAADLEAARK